MCKEDEERTYLITELKVPDLDVTGPDLGVDLLDIELTGFEEMTERLTEGKGNKALLYAGR